jgi:hypothetical protein
MCAERTCHVGITGMPKSSDSPQCIALVQYSTDHDPSTAAPRPPAESAGAEPPDPVLFSKPGVGRMSKRSPKGSTTRSESAPSSSGSPKSARTWKQQARQDGRRGGGGGWIGFVVFHQGASQVY